MCGVAGMVAAHVDTDVLRTTTQRMTDRMVARGPDAHGLWTATGVALGHRRLAIVDLDARANQPMLSHDQRYAIVFNGEIYNHRSLRRDLEDDGVRFATSSDTEVLLCLFAREGEKMLPKLRGMFALAIWDTATQTLFLARDPYGIKPLYYAQAGGAFVFASQVKALMQSGLVGRDPEPAGCVGYYLWGSVPDPWTLYRGVFALPAGHTLQVTSGKTAHPVVWHDIRGHWQGGAVPHTRDALHARVQEAVRDSVRDHVVADVPVSVFLSGGIDSATVAGLAAETGAKVHGITLGFDEFAGHAQDEVPVASAIAAHYGIPHHVRRVSSKEFQEDLPKILAAMDQPSVDGINTWFASKAAAELGYKVALSGVGGDELFCGYAHFRQIGRYARIGRVLARVPGAAALLRAPCALLARGPRRPKVAGIPAWGDSVEGWYFLRRGLFLPSELCTMMSAETVREGLLRLGGDPPGMSPAYARDALAAVGLLESTHYMRNQLLRDSDWASMAHSLELRTPLVDATLLRALGPVAAGFGAGVGKALLAGAPQRPLPASVQKRRKTGFSLPMAGWLAHPASFGQPGGPWARRWASDVLGALMSPA